MQAMFSRATVTILVIVGTVCAQAPSQNTAQPGAARFAFEVATVKPSEPGAGFIGFLADPSGRVRIGNANLKMLVQYAFHVDARQILTAIPLADSTRYEIEALPPVDLRAVGGPTMRAWPNDKEREMIRSLLLERFGLKYHEDTREMNAYLLVRTKGKLAMTPPKDQTLDPRGGVIMKQGGIVDGEAEGNNLTMPNFAENLGGWVDRLVVDQTGLSGAYDFHVEPVDPNNTEVMVGTQAALHQLGLELKPGKAAVKVIVVDQFTAPTPN